VLAARARHGLTIYNFIGKKQGDSLIPDSNKRIDHCLLSLQIVNFMSVSITLNLEIIMDIRRLILAFIMPPAAVMNKEAGTIMLTGILTVWGWIPGVVAALIMISKERCNKSAEA
jgi:uncharacterized membrane protein YqaE (UPF0057 family)